MYGERIEGDGHAPEGQVEWQRQEVGGEASIQIYLDAGWYWEDHRLTHPEDRALTIRIDPATRDWYPTAGIARLMDAVVEREGDAAGLFEDDRYPAVKLSRLLVEEIERARRDEEL